MNEYSTIDSISPIIQGIANVLLTLPDITYVETQDNFSDPEPLSFRITHIDSGINDYTNGNLEYKHQFQLSLFYPNTENAEQVCRSYIYPVTRAFANNRTLDDDSLNVSEALVTRVESGVSAQGEVLYQCVSFTLQLSHNEGY